MFSKNYKLVNAHVVSRNLYQELKTKHGKAQPLHVKLPISDSKVQKLEPNEQLL